MNDFHLYTIIGVLSLVLSGCGGQVDAPLIFVQSNTLGISVSGSAPEQGGEITLGYKGRDFAIIPAVVRQNNGDATQVMSNSGEGFSDALSVLGQFEANAKATNPEVGLGKFFATGIAAQKLADGFAAKLGHEAPKDTSQ